MKVRKTRKTDIILNTIKSTFIKNKKVKIKNITFEVTSLCNSHCSTCNMWRNKPRKDELTTQEIEKFFSSQELKKVKNIIITGGEPVIRKDIIEIVTIIHKFLPQVTLSFSTNGILPDRVIAVVKECINLDVNLVLGVSLDGLGEAHDKKRGTPGNFKKVDYLIKSVNKLKKETGANLKIVIGHCFDEIGYQTLDEVEKYAKENNCDFLTQMTEDFDYYKPKEERKVISDDFLDKQKDIKFGVHKWYKKRKEMSPIQQKMFDKIIKMQRGFQKEIMIRTITGQMLKYDCFSLRTFFVLLSNGDIVPCLRYGNFVFGNVKNNNLNEIFKSDKYQQGIEMANKCDGCLNTWCTGWSAIENLLPFWKVALYAMFRR